MAQQPTTGQRGRALQASSRGHASEHGAPSIDSFKDRIRRWRERAILQATGEVLLEAGCVRLTMDAVASRAGVAKGSLYMHTPGRRELIDWVLDEWTTEMPPPHALPSTQEEFLDAAPAGLLIVVDRGGSQPAAAFPCCLHVSPCPSGWPERWAVIAATPFVRGLVLEGSFDQARQVIWRFVGGASPKTPAP